MIQIHKDYEGGNIHIVSARDPHVVVLEQEIRDSGQWWFYWNFAARLEEEREVLFRFANGEVVGPWGPAFSYDRIHWSWLGPQISPKSFAYTFSKEHPCVYFAFSLPYQMEHFELFYDAHRDHPLLDLKVLCTSKQNREVPVMLIGNPEAPNRIVCSCRHHACESTVNYVLEGMIEQLLYGEDASGFLNRTCIHYVPFVDIDGVQNGDQGKGRAPHDHNRDYIQTPIYAETTALMQYVREIKPILGIDFHCPHRWGERNDHVFFVKVGTEADLHIEAFGRELESLTRPLQGTGEIVFEARQNIEMGEDWNQPYPTFSDFMIKQQVPFAFSYEIPYFGLEGMQVTVESLRRFGALNAIALRNYLDDSKT